MPEYLSPGVYVEEITGAQPIEGVSTSTTGFVGVTQQGPLDGLGPVLVTSYPEFERTFGGYFTPGFSGPGFNFLPHAVAGFFNNGGKRLYIKRVASHTSPPSAANAANGLENSAATPTLMTRLKSSAAKNATAVKLLSMLGVENATTFTLTQVKNGLTTVSPTLTATSYDNSTNTVWFTPALADNFDARYTTVALTGATASTASGAPASLAGSPLAPVANAANFGLQAASPGIWGNTPTDPTAAGLRVQITASSRAQSQVQTVSSVGGGTNNLVTLNSGQNFYAGAIVEFDAAGSYSVAGSVTSGTFVAGEQVGQSAKATLIEAVTGAMIISTLVGTPDAAGTWVGQTSGAIYTPTAAPVASLKVAGAVSGTKKFVLGEQVIQSVSGAKANAVGVMTTGELVVTALTGPPPTATDPWNGQTSTAVFTPTAVPAAGSDAITGSVTSGTFVAAEQVVQSTPYAKANLVGTVPGAGPMIVRTLIGTADATNTWVGKTSGAVYTPTALPVSAFAGKFYAKVLSIQGTGIQLVNGLTAAQLAAVTANSSNVPPIPTFARTCEFDVSATSGNVSENFRGLTLDNTTPYFYGTAILNGSSLLSVPQFPSIPSDQTTTDPSTMPFALDGLNVAMAGGTDGGTPTPLDFVGNDGGPGNRTGIAALVDALSVSIIGAPGITEQDVQNALITQCELLKYRFAILDPKPSPSGGTPSIQDIQNQRDLYDTKYAAIYYPRLIVSDPLTDMPLTIPPSGHMAGIYAQTDNDRGVWKAPANVVIDSIDNLELKISKGEQDILNPEPNNICCLRDFRAQGRGLRVYGARCITSLTEWKYINVRRLFIFLEASLDQGTQWAVFEPNDQTLWNRLIQSVSAFLTTVWREGGLMGSKPEEAYFVKCGRDTMSQDDIENGRLIMLIGVAPVFPAEFVIIRIGQWAGGSSVQEL
jgi:phage tail sheath protein FI